MAGDRDSVPDAAGGSREPQYGIPLPECLRLPVAHRSLVWQLLKRDLHANVRASILGLGWIIITPLVLVAIYTFVFGVVLESAWFSRAGNPLEVPLIYFTGLIAFSFFMEVITRAPDFIRANKTYVTKIVFPVEVLDWVLVGTALLKLAASLVLLTVFLAIVKGGLPAGLLAVPLVLLPFVLLTTGLAWFLSAVGTYVRDLNQLLLAIGPVLMFISPIFYSIDQMPEAFRPFFWANPLTFVLETLRSLLFFDGGIAWQAYGLYWIGALAVFTGGFAFFRRARPGFADVI